MNWRRGRKRTNSAKVGSRLGNSGSKARQGHQSFENNNVLRGPKVSPGGRRRHRHGGRLMISVFLGVRSWGVRSGRYGSVARGRRGHADPAGVGAQNLSRSAARRGDRPAEPGVGGRYVGGRYYVHSDWPQAFLIWWRLSTGSRVRCWPKRCGMPAAGGSILPTVFPKPHEGANAIMKAGKMAGRPERYPSNLLPVRLFPRSRGGAKGTGI